MTGWNGVMVWMGCGEQGDGNAVGEVQSPQWGNRVTWVVVVGAWEFRLGLPIQGDGKGMPAVRV